MELLAKIKADRMRARKAKDTVATTLLTTLVGEAETLIKGKGKYDTVVLIKKFLKGINDTVKANGGPTFQLAEEKFILERYLPEVYSELELTQIIGGMDNSFNMGKIMAELKKSHADMYDGRMASELAKKKVIDAADRID